LRGVPIRMNLVPIEIVSYSTQDTLFDIDFVEPVGSRRYNTASRTHKLKGQVEYNFTDKQTPARHGDVTMTDGHLVFKQTDLEKECAGLKKGDKIISIANRACDYLITELRPQAHLNGQSNTIHIFFKTNTLEHGTET